MAILCRAAKNSLRGTSTLNDLVHLTPLRIPLMNPPPLFRKSQLRVLRSSLTNGTTRKESNDGSRVWSISGLYCIRGQSYVWRLPKYWPSNPLTDWRVCTPRLWCGGRTHSLGAWREVWGSTFWMKQTHLCTLHMKVLCGANQWIQNNRSPC
jgi:hypothetical protein